MGTTRRTAAVGASPRIPLGLIERAEGLHRSFTPLADALGAMRMSFDPGGPAVTEVIVLSAPACHLCEDALEALAVLGREFPIRVREVGMQTPEARELLRTHRPSMPPAVLVDGVLFSVGRLPRKKLRRLLERAA